MGLVKMKTIKYQFGIGRREYTAPSPEASDIIREFLQAMKGEIGFWERQIVVEEVEDK